MRRGGVAGVDRSDSTRSTVDSAVGEAARPGVAMRLIEQLRRDRGTSPCPQDRSPDSGGGAR